MPRAVFAFYPSLRHPGILFFVLLLGCIVFPTPGAHARADAEGFWSTTSSIPGRTVVDLRSLPISRWQPGDPLFERLEDFDEDMKPITPQALAQARAFVDPLAVAPYPLSRGVTLPGPSVDVAGLTAPFLPPDPAGDVGPNHYIQAVNASTVQIFDKNGATLAGPFALDSLWVPSGGTGQCASGRGDPIIVYDSLADRWLMSEFAQTGNHLCVYISQTPNPVSGGWFVYDFPTPSFPDYPKYGVWPNAYLVTSFEGSLGAYALDRTNMLAGNVATSIRFTVPQLPVGGGFRSTRLLPANLDGPPPPVDTPGLFFRPVEAVQDQGNQVDRLEIYELTPDFVTPGSSAFGLAQSLTPADFGLVPCSPGVRDCVTQQGSGQRLDALSGRAMMQLQYRNFGTHEVLLTNESVNAGGGTVGVRWWELRRSGGNWSIFQEGTYAPDDQNRWMASVAMNGAGQIGLGFSLAGSANFPSIGYTIRQASDPLGTFPNGEVVAAAGTSAQTSASARWGDYSSINIDPTDDRTFWYTTQYSGDRLSRVLAFAFDSTLFADGFESGDTSAWSHAIP